MLYNNLILKMEERDVSEGQSPPNTKLNEKYKEDNPQAPDKNVTKSSKKRGRKAANAKNKAGKHPASSPKIKKKKAKAFKGSSYKLK